MYESAFLVPVVGYTGDWGSLTFHCSCSVRHTWETSSLGSRDVAAVYTSDIDWASCSPLSVSFLLLLHPTVSDSTPTPCCSKMLFRLDGSEGINKLVVIMISGQVPEEGGGVVNVRGTCLAYLCT